MRGVQAELHGLNRDLELGRISPDDWADKFDAALLKGHSEAIRLGRARAGALPLSSEELFHAARGAKDGEAEYLQNFLDAVHARDPRYFDDNGNFRSGSLDPRTSLYVGKMRGSANEAFTEGSPDDAEFDWELGVERHCDDCPRLAAASPYTKDTLHTSPGDGGTECLGNCTCILVRSDGVRGFPRAHHDGDVLYSRDDLGEDGAKLVTDYTTTGKESYEAAKSEGISWAKGDRPSSAWQDVYDHTQTMLEELGIDEIDSYRGFQVDRDSEAGQLFAEAKPGDSVSVLLEFASFSDRKNVGTGYANMQLQEHELGITLRRIIKREDIVISHHVDKGMKNEHEIIAKSQAAEIFEVVQIDDRKAAKKGLKSGFAAGRYLGQLNQETADKIMSSRMVPPDYYTH